MTVTQSNVLVSPAFAVVNDLQDDCCYVIISSTDKYDHLSARNNVLVLHFEDTELENKPGAVSDYDIFRIIRFIREAEANDVFISCDAGESRSPAVAAALLRLSDFSDDFIWNSDEYRPNVLVYRKFLEFSGGFEAVTRSILKKSPEEYRQSRRPDRPQSPPPRSFYETGGPLTDHRIDPMKDTVGYDEADIAGFLNTDAIEGWEAVD